MPLYLTGKKNKNKKPIERWHALSLQFKTWALVPSSYILPCIWYIFHLSFSVTIIGTFIAFCIHHLNLPFLPRLLIDPSDGSRICSGCYGTGRALCACQLLPVWVQRSHAQGRRPARRSGSPSVDERRENASRPHCSYNADSNTSRPSKQQITKVYIRTGLQLQVWSFARCVTGICVFVCNCLSFFSNSEWHSSEKSFWTSEQSEVRLRFTGLWFTPLCHIVVRDSKFDVMRKPGTNLIVKTLNTFSWNCPFPRCHLLLCVFKILIIILAIYSFQARIAKLIWSKRFLWNTPWDLKLFIYMFTIFLVCILLLLFCILKYVLLLA